MPFRINIDVRGNSDVAQALKDVRKRFAPGLVQEAILPAAVIVRDEARRRAPVGAGLRPSGEQRLHLWEAIFASKGKPNLPNVIAGVSHKTAPHAHLVEFGTDAHVITPRKENPVRGGSPRRFLRVLGKFVRSVQHPGAKKHPFFRPAARVTRPRVLEAIKRGCEKLLAGVLSK